jgi:MFS family permease
MYSDRVGSSLRTLSVCSVLAATSVLAIWLPINYHRSLGGLITFSVVFGLTSGGFVSLVSPALIEVAGGHSHDLGTMAGTFFAIISLATLTGLPIQGAITSPAAGGADGMDLVGLIVFCGVVMLAGTGLVAWACWLSEKRNQKEAVGQSGEE